MGLWEDAFEQYQMSRQEAQDELRDSSHDQLTTNQGVQMMIVMDFAGSYIKNLEDRLTALEKQQRKIETRLAQLETKHKESQQGNTLNNSHPSGKQG